jgi:hypothetical protein
MSRYEFRLFLAISWWNDSLFILMYILEYICCNILYFSVRIQFSGLPLLLRGF